MSDLLIAETPHQVVPALAAEIGLHECLLLQQLHWLIIRSRFSGIVRRFRKRLTEFPTDRLSQVS